LFLSGHIYRRSPPQASGISFTGVTQNGSSTANTTQLTLTFNKAVAGLAATDITLSGVIGVTRGTLSAATGTGPVTYTLGINGFTTGGTLKVAVAKTGFTFTPASRDVTIFYNSSNPNPTAAALNSVTQDGSTTKTTTKLTLTFDKAITGLAATDIALSGVNGVTAGTLSGSGPIYDLTLNGVTASGTLTVAVSKAGNTITPPSKTVEIFFVDPSLTQVTFSKVEADGTATTVTSTKLTLTFSAAITGLTADNITLTTSTGATKGALTPSSPAGTYDLAITGVTSAGNVSVEVSSPATYNITGGPQSTIVFVDYSTLTFETAVGIKDLAKGTGSSILDVNTEEGYIFRDDTGNGYGDTWVSVKIPEDQLPIIPSDKIVLTYIASASAPLTVKKNQSLNDVTPAMNSTFGVNTNGTGARTLEIPAVRYGDQLPTSVLYFQSRPPSAAWKLKIIDITVVHGDPIKITAPVSGLKPVSGETPVVSAETLEYNGTISWSPSSSAFTQGQAYTATINLTAKPGYTFTGVAADTFPVSNADTVTHATGSTTLAITAVFPETAAATEAKIVEFLDGEVKAYAATTVITVNSVSQYSVESYSSNEASYTYFPVTFETGVKLSDYSKIDFTVQTISGSNQYKDIYVAAFAPAATMPANFPQSNATFLIAKKEGGNPLGGYGTYNFTLDLTLDSNAQKAANSILVAILVRSDNTNKAEYKISSVRFHNDK